MKRHAVRVVVAFGAALAFSVASANAATATQDKNAKAKEECTARWDEEVKGGTVPGGMKREKYISQCMRHYVASEEQKEEIQATDAATTTTNGQTQTQGQ